jgi:RNA polymerase sigma factor (TIGR02999 family)
MSDVTEVIEAMDRGEPGAAEKLLPIVYCELRKLAASKMSGDPAGQTLQPTALVHEMWLRLFGAEQPRFEGRGHFFGIAAEAMRRILIERARRKKSLKRGANAERINLDDVDLAATADDDTLLLVDEALQKLAIEDPAAAKFIQLKFFAGLTNAEAAEALGLSERTARRNWTFARAWLYREIRKQEAG